MSNRDRKSERQQLHFAVKEVPADTPSPNPAGAVAKAGEFRDMTRKQAIRAKCLDCCGGSRAEVRRCESEECPLWKYRLGTCARIDSGVRTAAKRGVFDAISRKEYEEVR